MNVSIPFEAKDQTSIKFCIAASWSILELTHCTLSAEQEDIIGKAYLVLRTWQNTRIHRKQE